MSTENAFRFILDKVDKFMVQYSPMSCRRQQVPQGVKRTPLPAEERSGRKNSYSSAALFRGRLFFPFSQKHSLKFIRRCAKVAKVEQKQPIVEEIKSHLDGAKSVVLVDYLGLTVEQDTKLRRETRKENLVYKVYKNTMIRRAIEGTEFADLDKDLEGPTAIAISKDDATAPARVLAKFGKDVKAFELKSGVVEGIYYDAAGIAEVAKIPSREVLLSRLLGSLQSPITNLARVLNQVAEQKAE